MVIHQALAPAATTIQQAIASRVSIHAFAPGHALADADIEQLVQQATQAPTAFNFQNWRFVAVRSPAAKQRLRAVAYGQQKVEDAAVVFIICGSLQAH
ncbi:MAG: nitroreductase family protein, partial [Comamonas sp.]|nr:nitroreductase family protein [Comamonas sp.]